MIATPGPWDDFAPQQQAQPQAAPQQAGPWEDYAAPQQQAAPVARPHPAMRRPVQAAPAAPQGVPQPMQAAPQGDSFTPFADAQRGSDAFATGQFVPKPVPTPPLQRPALRNAPAAAPVAPPGAPQAPAQAAPEQKFDLGDYVAQELQNSFGKPWEKLKTDTGDMMGATVPQIKAENANLPLWRKIVPMADPAGQRTGAVIGDLANMAASPFNAAVHAAIVRPAASAATKYLGGDQANNEGIINTGMMGMGPRAGVAAPALAPDAALLAGEGVRLTPGMSNPGLMHKVEGVLAKIPVVGAKVAGEQKHAVSDLNLAVGNRALAPIGETLPAGMKPGRDMISHIDDRIGNAYQQTLPQLTVTADAPFKAGLAAAKAKPKFLAPEHQKYIDNIAKSLDSTLSAPIDGIAWKQIDSQLGKVAKDNHANSALAAGIRDLQDEWRSVAYRSNSPVAGQVANIDQAYRMAGAVRKAATYKTKEGLEDLGTFTPAQLDNAIKASDLGGKRAYASGNAPLQDISDAATRVIGNPTGAPGWAHGGGGAIGTAAALWLEHNGFHIPPEMLLGAAATMIPYTKTGRAIGGALARQPGVPVAIGAQTQPPPLNARNY